MKKNLRTNIINCNAYSFIINFNRLSLNIGIVANQTTGETKIVYICIIMARRDGMISNVQKNINTFVLNVSF